MKNNSKAIFYITIGIIIITIGVVWWGDKPATNNQIKQITNQQTKPIEINGYKDMSVSSLASSLKNKDFTLINVHIPYIGDIAGTDLSIPFNAISGNLDKLPQNKDAKIVLYCQSGRMSEIASKKLVDLGYTNVYNLKGGMNQWQKEGYKLIQK